MRKEAKPSFEETRLRVAELLRDSEYIRLKRLRCHRCCWHQSGRPCVWPVCLYPLKTGKTVEKK